jgi:hypothetical protein
MADGYGTDQETLAKQSEMFRLALTRHGLSLTVLASETGVSLNSLKSYSCSNIFARAKMPLPVFVKLCRVIPDDCTSVILADAGKHIGSNEGTDGDFDALGREASHFVAEKLDAEADGVVTHIEKRKLKDRAQRVAAVARKVAA